MSLAYCCFTYMMPVLTTLRLWPWNSSFYYYLFIYSFTYLLTIIIIFCKTFGSDLTKTNHHQHNPKHPGPLSSQLFSAVHHFLITSGTSPPRPALRVSRFGAAVSTGVFSLAGLQNHQIQILTVPWATGLGWGNTLTKCFEGELQTSALHACPHRRAGVSQELAPCPVHFLHPNKAVIATAQLCIQAAALWKMVLTSHTCNFVWRLCCCITEYDLLVHHLQPVFYQAVHSTAVNSVGLSNFLINIFWEKNKNKISFLVPS